MPPTPQKINLKVGHYKPPKITTDVPISSVTVGSTLLEPDFIRFLFFYRPSVVLHGFNIPNPAVLNISIPTPFVSINRTYILPFPVFVQTNVFGVKHVKKGQIPGQKVFPKQFEFPQRIVTSVQPPQILSGPTFLQIPPLSTLLQLLPVNIDLEGTVFPDKINIYISVVSPPYVDLTSKKTQILCVSPLFSELCGSLPFSSLSGRDAVFTIPLKGLRRV